MRLGRLKFRAIFATLFVGAFLLATGSPVFAQTFPPLVGAVADQPGYLNADEINAVAEQLEQLGAKPLVVLVQNQPDPDDNAFVRTVAANYGYANGDLVDPALVAIVVSLNQRRLMLLYGDNYIPVFEAGTGGQTVGDALQSKMRPLLAAGLTALAAGDEAQTSEKLTEAFVSGLTDAATAIDRFQNPPSPTPRPTAAPTATPQPPVVNNFDFSGLGTTLLWIVGIIAALIILAVLGPIGWRAWRKAQETAARRRALQEQLVQARNVAADMITDLEFPADPAEQLQFRFLALALGNERQEELAQLQAHYREMYNRVSAALARYNAANEARYATEEELTAGIAQYQTVQSEINAAATFLKDVAERSRQVEGQIASAPGEVGEAKKALAAVTASVERLAAALPDLYKADPAKITARGSALLSSAEAALGATPAKPLTAYEAATSARDSASGILASLQRVGAAYGVLGEFRNLVAGYRKNGFKLTHSDEHADNMLGLLSRSLKELEDNGDSRQFENIIKGTEDGLVKARAYADSMAGLQKANEQTLAGLQKAGEQLSQYIGEGALAFDKVDEYAESSWADIRGNGTEAQKAADQAQALWEEAGNLNALTEDSPQDFERASELAAQSGRLIEKARDLITSIIERLKNVEESKRAAGVELEAAERDIEAGQGFIARFDRDITPKPSDMLKQAANLLAQARDGSVQDRADWIEVVRTARAANDLADKALAEARSQQEAMQARRLKVETLRQQAEASVSRAANFANVHRGDLDGKLFHSLTNTQEVLQKALARSEQISGGRLEDVALAQALDEVAGLFGEVQATADSVFAKAQEQFEAMESLRRQANGAIQGAAAIIEQTNFYITLHGSVVGYKAKQLLQQARAAMPAWSESSDVDALNRLIRDGNHALSLAQQANREAREDVREDEIEQAEEEERRRQESSGGSIFGWGFPSSGGSSSSSGGGWSWGGGSSSSGSSGGSSWGGGGSSGGGFGGGGSSSRSFGGGGSSSSGFGKGGSSSSGW